MLTAPFRVVLDANVLFPFTLRDTLLRAAEEDLYQPYWSAEILEETRRNLVATKQTDEQQAARLVGQMKKVFPAAMVDGYESLVAGLTNDEKDRHVAAAAVKIGAQVIVTSNTRDFEPLPDGVEAQTPDEFLSNLFDLDPKALVGILERQAAALKAPPATFDVVLDRLAKVVPEFVASVREHLVATGE